MVADDRGPVGAPGVWDAGAPSGVYELGTTPGSAGAGAAGAARRALVSLSWRALIRASKTLRLPGGNMAGGRAVRETSTSVWRAASTVWVSVRRCIRASNRGAAPAIDSAVTR